MLHIVLITEVVLTLLIVVLIWAVPYSIVYFVQEKLCKCYWNWKTKSYIRQIEKENEEYLQQCQEKSESFIRQLRERELYEAEKRKYPLFYWRETCAKRTLKEGIV